MYKIKNKQDTVFDFCSVRENSIVICIIYQYSLGTAVAQWLRCCATNQKVAGSISDGVIGIFH